LLWECYRRCSWDYIPPLFVGHEHPVGARSSAGLLRIVGAAGRDARR
jgi:hypothetical protein